MLMSLWSFKMTRHEWGWGDLKEISYFLHAFSNSFPHLLSSPCRGDVQSDGGDDELLHTAGPAAAAAGRHGSERLQHGPIPTGAHPPTDARGPHEPIWWASTKKTPTPAVKHTHTHTHTRLSLDQPHSSPVWDVRSGRTRLVEAVRAASPPTWDNTSMLIYDWVLKSIFKSV